MSTIEIPGSQIIGRSLITRHRGQKRGEVLDGSLTAYIVVELSLSRTRSESRIVEKPQMPYLSGVLTGIVLTVLVAFLVDQLGADSGRIVNWAVQVRKDVHEATAPDNEVGETH